MQPRIAQKGGVVPKCQSQSHEHSLGVAKQLLEIDHL
jgi:hypothetical protein